MSKLSRGVTIVTLMFDSFEFGFDPNSFCLFELKIITISSRNYLRVGFSAKATLMVSDWGLGFMIKESIIRVTSRL